MRYALNLGEDGRILSACIVLEGGSYEGMPIVEELPEGDAHEYRYVDGGYVHDPLPPRDEGEQEKTTAERIEALEEENRHLKEALELLLSGATEEADADG